MTDLFLLAAVGATSGVIAGLVGLAGGIVIVPVLTWVYGPQALHAAIVVSWFSVLFNSFGAAASHWRLRTPDQRLALLHGARWYLGGAILVTPVIAAYASGHRGLVSGYLVAALQLCLAAVMLWPMGESSRPPRHNPTRDASFGGVIGGVSTLIGVGGGTYTIAYFVYGAGTQFRDAIATANLTGLVVGMLSVAGYLAALLVYGSGAVIGSAGPLSAAGMAAVVLGGVAAAPLGVMLSRRLPVKRLRQILVAALIISAIRLLATSA